jgi:hypothetical protein
MSSLDRRSFLGLSLGSLAAASYGAVGCAKESPSSKTGSRPDTFFLTWQRDPTTTMTVQWVGPAVDVSTVPIICEPAGKAQGVARTATTVSRPYPDTKLHLHRAELTGLTPGTEYQFRIGKQPLTHRFRTMPAKMTDSFTFVSGGDCGTSEHAINNNINAARQNPMFAMIGGDLGYDNGRIADVSLDFLTNYSRHMVDSENRLIPMVVCMGNHEVNGSYGKTRKDAPYFFACHDGLYAERSFATLDFGDYLSLVLLDTGHVAPIDGEQTDWLGKALAERQGLAHVIAVNHVPAYPSYRAFESSGNHEGTGHLNRECWAPLFEKHNVDVVLEHHDHTFKRTHPIKGGLVDKNGVTYLGDGSWGKLRAPKTPEERPYLAAVSQAYHMTVHRLEGEQRFHMAMADSGRIVDVCMTGKRPQRAMGRGA